MKGFSHLHHNIIQHECEHFVDSVRNCPASKLYFTVMQRKKANRAEGHKDALSRLHCCYTNLLCEYALLVGKERNTAKFVTRPASKQARLFYLRSAMVDPYIFYMHKLQD